MAYAERIDGQPLTAAELNKDIYHSSTYETLTVFNTYTTVAGLATETLVNLAAGSGKLKSISMSIEAAAGLNLDDIEVRVTIDDVVILDWTTWCDRAAADRKEGNCMDFDKPFGTSGSTVKLKIEVKNLDTNTPAGLLPLIMYYLDV